MFALEVQSIGRMRYDALVPAPPAARAAPLQEPAQLHAKLVDYITSFSANVRDIFLDKFLFTVDRDPEELA